MDDVGGALGHASYVLWHRMRASFGKGVPPRWLRTGKVRALWFNGVRTFALWCGEVVLSLHKDDRPAVHEGALGGVHAWSVAVPDDGKCHRAHGARTPHGAAVAAQGWPHMRSGMSMSRAMPLETVSLTRGLSQVGPGGLRFSSLAMGWSW